MTTTTTAATSAVQRGAGGLQEDAHHIGGAGGRSFLQQDLHDVEVAHERRHVQGCQARLFGGKRGTLQAYDDRIHYDDELLL